MRMSYEEAILTAAHVASLRLRDTASMRNTFRHIDDTIERNRKAGVKPAADTDVAE